MSLCESLFWTHLLLYIQYFTRKGYSVCVSLAWGSGLEGATQLRHGTEHDVDREKFSPCLTNEN